MSIISVKDMCLWYGDHQALKNVNMEIPEKSITAVVTLLSMPGELAKADLDNLLKEMRKTARFCGDMMV